MTICWLCCHAHLPQTMLPPYPACPLVRLSLTLFLSLSLSLSLTHFASVCDFWCTSPSVAPWLFAVRRKVPPKRIAVRHKLLYFIVQFLFIIFFGYFLRCVLLLMLHLLFRFSSDFSVFCWVLCGTCWVRVLVELPLGEGNDSLASNCGLDQLGRHSHCRLLENCFLKIKYTQTHILHTDSRQTFSYKNNSNKLELLNDDPQEWQQ